MSSTSPMRVPMTADEKLACSLIRGVRMLPASFEKRFREAICNTASLPEPTISEKEQAQLWRLTVRYRKQWTHPEKDRILKLAESLAAPDFRKRAKAEQEQRRIDQMRLQFGQAVKPSENEKPRGRVFELE